MSYSGADSSLHRHSIPNPLERYLNTDFELGAQWQHASSGIVKAEDTLDMALLYGQQYGRHPAKSSSPTLEFPLWSLRASAADIKASKEDLGPTYQKVLEMLPEDMRTKLTAELAKPMNERSADFIALNGLLETAAAYMLLIDRAGKLDENPAIGAMPKAFLEGFENFVGDALDFAKQQLEGGL